MTNLWREIENRLGWERIFSALTSLTVISTLVVFPYSMGYFSVIDIRSMSFFSFGDFYYFSLVQILISIFALIIYFNMNRIFTLPLALLQDSVGANKRERYPSRPPPVAIRMLRLLLTPLGFHLFLLICLPAVLMFFSLVTPWLRLLPLAVIVLIAWLAAAREIMHIRPVVFYPLIVILFELFLFLHGVAEAHESVQFGRRVEVRNQNNAFIGNLVFVGGLSILIFDDKANEFVLVKTDSEVYVKIGSYSRVPMECINRLYFSELRYKMGLTCHGHEMIERLRRRTKSAQYRTNFDS